MNLYEIVLLKQRAIILWTKPKNSKHERHTKQTNNKKNHEFKIYSAI